MKFDEKKDREKIIKKSYGLFAGVIVIIVTWFIFGYYFDIWGKEFSVLPTYVVVISFFMLILVLIYGFYILNFLAKNFNVLKQEEEESKRKRKIKKQK